MKRLVWGLVLSLPWTVQIDTADYGKTDNGQAEVEVHSVYAQHQLPGGMSVFVPCGNDQEACSDFVEAMNSAHRFREAAKKTTSDDLYWKRPSNLPDVPTSAPEPQEQQ